ncbi:MAG TPA: polyamine aminopropyltransferase, partial [Alphaproteobacteria bacterium]|nr:polyamine aminopropyltransferase [Alphaproteobacteria bacterium]
VVEFSKRYLPSICGDAFDDPRLELVIADGAKYVAETQDRFDVAIVDSTDPVGPGEALFTETFYGNVKRCLNEGGVVVTQNGVPFLQADELSGTIRSFRGLFRDASCYLATVPTYVGGPMAFGWGTDDEALRAVPEDELARRFEAAGIETRYYTPAVHRAAFALPVYIRDMIR